MKTKTVLAAAVLACLMLIFTACPSEPTASAQTAANKNALIDSVAEWIVVNAKITTFDQRMPEATIAAIKDGKFLAVGGDDIFAKYKGDQTKIIDAKGRRMIPGLTDVHMHLISYGATFNREIRWDGIKSLAEGLKIIKAQAGRPPAGEWVRVLGGWSPNQFAEKRLPTPSELESVAPNTPVMVTHLWDRIITNKAGLAALKIDGNTPNPKGGTIEKDARGNPTGIIVTVSNWAVILNYMSKLPPPASIEERMSSTTQFMRELNRYGITSVIDGGAGDYPKNYEAIMNLTGDGKSTVRVAGTLYPNPGASEAEQIRKWLDTVRTDDKNPFFRIVGAGEILSYASFDMTNFEQERPALPELEAALKPTLTAVIKKGWSFRLHAAYDETVSRMLDVIEEINRETPLTARWSIEHAETLTAKNMERIKNLGGGIGVQDRIFFQGEEFIKKYGKTVAMKEVVPVKEMLQKGIPVGFGTDSMRIASYNPWLTPYFFVSGKTVGGADLLPAGKRLTRQEALRLNTLGSVWFSGDETVKGSISAGKFADFALLSADYFAVPEEEIKSLQSVLTVVGGKAVYAAGEYALLAPLAPAVLPEWSYWNRK